MTTVTERKGSRDSSGAPYVETLGKVGDQRWSPL